jgi:hypothetical protein
MKSQRKKKICILICYFTRADQKSGCKNIKRASLLERYQQIHEVPLLYSLTASKKIDLKMCKNKVFGKILFITRLKQVNSLAYDTKITSRILCYRKTKVALVR